MKAILSAIAGVFLTTLPAILTGVTNPLLHAVIAGAGAVVGVFVHNQATTTKLWNGNPFGSITVTTILVAILGFIAAHLDPSHLTALGTAAWGVIGGVVGALTHHAVTLPQPGTGTSD